MSGWAAVAVTVAVIAASGFFVAMEFAVIASRRTRLEEAAMSSRAARAALRSSSEVSVLLAACQLGITACTLALGAITKPALKDALEPVLETLGLPDVVVYPVAFTLALLVATFLHLVVGEMAPKSWAISHPERTATLFALPMRGFMIVFRPVLLLLNEAANALVRRVGVEPVDEVAVEQNPDDLRQLVQHSAATGDLDETASEQLASALQATRVDVGDILTDVEPVAVPSAATVGDLQERSIDSGHLRILVADDDDIVGVVHVRDTLTTDRSVEITSFVRDLHRLDRDMTVLDAVSALREAGEQLAVVETTSGGTTVITMADLLSQVMPAAGNTREPARTQ